MGPQQIVDQPGFAQRIRGGERAAIAAVVDAYLAQVLRAACAAGLDAATAEDVVQATFATFIESAARFEGRSHVRTWLFGILYRKISEARRWNRRWQDVEEIDTVLDGRFRANGHWLKPPAALEKNLSDAELRAAFADCIQSVPERQRAAFTLREVDQLSTEEICKILEVSPTNLGVMLYRARNRLRECLEAKGIEG